MSEEKNTGEDAKAKMLGGQFTEDFEQIHAEDIDNRSMITIGG